MINGSASIFQLVENNTRLLHTSTNLKTEDGKRSIGGVLDANDANPIYKNIFAKILRNEQVISRENIAGQDYITAYKPLLDSEGKVLGAFYMGI